MDASRYLVVAADDYGIGPETSRGILDLAVRRAVTGVVLLVNCPNAVAAVSAWQKAQPQADLGWHPNLTLDRPLTASAASLFAADGCFHPLGQLARRLCLGQINRRDVEQEWTAQYRRFLDLVGRPPCVVNTHQHVALFPPLGEVLLEVLRKQRPRPYVRRVHEPLRTLACIPGARPKRLFLSALGRVFARRQAHAGFPGADWLVGVTDPRWIADAEFFARWLRCTPGRVVELMCHPGYRDLTLVGRDSVAIDDDLMRRRCDERQLLERTDFLDAVRSAGFALVAPSRLPAVSTRGSAHAA
jgi:predicted glycoside hydrolase/deacetylase ChbG (UPF0249 family)